MATATLTVRIRPETHRKLSALAKQMETTLPEVLDKAITEFERRQFLEECNAAFARLRADPVAWEEELSERREWDCTLMDGLHDDPPYPWDEHHRLKAEQEKAESP